MAKTPAPRCVRPSSLPPSMACITRPCTMPNEQRGRRRRHRPLQQSHPAPCLAGPETAAARRSCASVAAPPASPAWRSARCNSAEHHAWHAGMSGTKSMCARNMASSARKGDAAAWCSLIVQPSSRSLTQPITASQIASLVGNAGTMHPGSGSCARRSRRGDSLDCVLRANATTASIVRARRSSAGSVWLRWSSWIGENSK